MAGKMKTKTLVKGFPVSKLKPYERNPRINKKAVDAVAKSIQRVGNNDPIEVNEKYVILCGHTRKLALEKLGIKTTDILVLSGLTEKQQKEYRITNNKTGELAEWDFEILEADFSADDLIEFGFDIKDLTQPEVVEDEAPPVPKKARTVRGDIYTLGNHRVMCGDSIVTDDVEKLMDGKKADMVFTDPPYNVAYGDSSNPRYTAHVLGKHRLIKNDAQTKDNWINFNVALAEILKLFNNGDMYVWGAPGPDGMRQRLAFIDSGLHWSATIIWKKNRLVLAAGKYQRMYEPCFYGWYKKSSFVGNRKNVEVWECDRPAKSELHPTMKPIALCCKGIQNSSGEGACILDLFLGSGSTLIACEQTNRICYGMELDEKYCDVIVQRWVNFTGGDVILNGKKIKWGKTDAARS